MNLWFISTLIALSFDSPGCAQLIDPVNKIRTRGVSSRDREKVQKRYDDDTKNIVGDIVTILHGKNKGIQGRLCGYNRASFMFGFTS